MTLSIAAPPPSREHARGVLLVALSALAFSSAGLFTRAIQADIWALIFWRALVAAAVTLALLGAQGRLRREWRQMGRAGWLAALLGALGALSYIPAFRLTSIANVAVIYAAAPLAAAMLAWWWLRERPLRTELACGLLALAGTLVVVGGSVRGGGLAGDLLAVTMTLLMAAMMVLYRRWPETPAALPAALASLLLLPVVPLWSAPLAVPLPALPWIALFGLVFAFAAVWLWEGARRLPAAETALLSALEVPLAPLLAWGLLGEQPATPTLVGGAITLVAVLASQWPRRAPR